MESGTTRPGPHTDPPSPLLAAWGGLEGDWWATPLGPPERWPAPLRAAVELAWASRWPVWIAWGPELTFLCNEACRPVLGERCRLGHAARDVWGEAWAWFGPRVAAVLGDGAPVDEPAAPLLVEFGGTRLETHHAASVGPLWDGGRPAGVVCVLRDDTERVIAARRLELLGAVEEGLAGADTEEEVYEALTRCLALEPRDLPFVLVYRCEGSDRGVRAVRVAAVGFDGEPDPRVGPAVLDPAGGCWPIAEAWTSGAAVAVDDLAGRCPALPTGAWRDPPATALVVPIGPAGAARPPAVMLAGLNPYRPRDAAVERFFLRLGSRIAAALAAARGRREERRADALAEIDGARSRFLGRVGRELRTPLTLMAGPLGALAGDLRVPDDAREQLRMVQRNGRRLLKLVESLLDFASIDAGRLQAAIEPVDLARVTAELVAPFRAATDRAQLELVVSCEPCGEVPVDRAMWEKIVGNLLSNAFKFTLRGRIAVRVGPVVAPRVDRGHGCVALEVADTGVGIPADEIPQLFDRFRADRSPVAAARGRTHEGAGIGLCLVRELAALHGGVVEVESEVGRGSTFRVVLPLGAAPASAPPAELRAETARAWVEDAVRWLPARDDPSAEADARIASEPGDDRPRILVADDDADMREYVRRLLEGRYRVQAVEDGAAAVAIARTHPPDLILSDVAMPNLDGFGLLEALRNDERTAAIPVILLSSRAGAETRAEGLEAGADDYLVKPFTARELLARISGLLALAEVRRAAARNEAELRADTSRVLDAVTDGFVLFDADLRFVYVNHRAEAAFGQPGSALIRRSLWEVLPELVGTAIDHRLREAVRQRHPARFDAWFAPWRQWLDLQCLPAADGGAALFLCDITRRRRTAAVLSGQAQALQLAIDGAPLEPVLEVLVRTIGAQGSPTLLGSIVRPSEDGRRLRHLAGPGGRDGFDWALEGLPLSQSACVGAAIASGQRRVTPDLERDPSALALHTVTAEAGIRACWAVPIRASGGRTLGACAVWDRNPGEPDPADVEAVELVARTAAIVIERDLERQERHLAARALRESEARHRQLADDAPGMAWVTEGDGSCTWVSRSWYAFTGRAQGSALGDGRLEPVHPDDRARTLEAVRRAHERHDAFRVEYRIRRADGVYRWAMDAATPRFDAEGRFLGLVGSVIDITDRKLAEVHQQALIEAERAARAQAERVNRMKDEFLATLSHELRTPLNAIHGWAQLLSRGNTTADPDTLRRGLEAIERNARAQKRMIEDLLDMSRIVSGKVRLELQPTDLVEVVEQSMLSVQPSADARGVRIEREIEAGVPMVVGDPGRLQQVLWNLLTNAIKFTPAGGRVAIRVDASDPVVVAVSDTGVGIAPDFLPSVFDRFRQADGSPSRRHTGLGLGLSIVKQLVELHGGTVAADSEGEGRGATFRITLPVWRGLDPRTWDSTDATPPTRSSASVAPPVAIPALSGLRILVVDDDPDARELVRRLLTAARAEVATAGSAREALEALDQAVPSVLISDIGMPEQDGYDLIRRIRARPPDAGGAVPAIALTAFARLQDRERALDAGYHAYLTKPVDPHELISSCRSLAAPRPEGEDG